MRRHPKLSPVVPIALLTLLVSATAGAQTFRWEDESGLVHFTQVPPPASCQTESCAKARGHAVVLVKPTEVAAAKRRQYREAVTSRQTERPEGDATAGRKAPRDIAALKEAQAKAARQF